MVELFYDQRPGSDYTDTLEIVPRIEILQHFTPVLSKKPFKAFLVLSRFLGSIGMSSRPPYFHGILSIRSRLGSSNSKFSAFGIACCLYFLFSLRFFSRR